MSAGPKRSTTTFLAFVVVFLTLSLVMYPEQGFKAGIAGMQVFWDVIFPSLLPFFILSELLLGIGVVHALGVLLEPLMRLLFAVPGVGAFSLSMGLAAGYPMDAVIASKYRKNNMISRVEGERLLAFTNTADPLFIFGAVAVGMFHSPELGMLLALAHYAGAFVVGIVYRFHGRGQDKHHVNEVVTEPRRQGNIFKRAFSEMMRAREADGRPLGKLLGDAVSDSMRTLFMICGFIMFFAVLVKIMTIAGIVPLLAMPLQALFAMLGLDATLVNPLIAGLFQMDFGTAAASVTYAPLIEQLIIVSFIIAWSGLCVHAQIASVVNGTDIRMKPYFIARLLHAVFAAIFTLVFYNMGWGQTAQTVMAGVAPMWSAVANPEMQHWTLSLKVLKNWFLVMGGVVVLSLVYHFFRQAKWVAFTARSTRRKSHL